LTSYFQSWFGGSTSAAFLFSQESTMDSGYIQITISAPQRTMKDEFRRTHRVYVQSRQVAQSVWHGLLSEEEQERLGGDLLAAYNAEPARGKQGRTIGMLARARGWLDRRAALEAAIFAYVITLAQYRQLDREIRELEPAGLRRVVSDNPNYGDEVDDEIRQSIHKYPLVLVTGIGVRELFWRGRRHPGAFHGKNDLWDTLCALVEAAKKGGGIEADLMRKTPAALKMLRYRLGGEIPGELNERITCSDRVYKLGVGARDIKIISVGLDSDIDVEAR
jgi:hypothetical protein